jgi:hypothetical protein
MLMSRDIKVLHIEPTDVCQAACPLCARETDGLFVKHLQHHLDMHEILQVFSSDKIEQLDKMFMCGNYGDPAAGRHTQKIYRSFRKFNPNIVLGMNTNGALQKPEWWRDLAKVLHQPRDYVVFSIDGLEDTNHIYRRNVNWRNLMNNVQAFIAAGGSAHWDMLVYRHNQHQVDACEQLARKLGFSWFRAKVSKRPFVNGLEFPVGWRDPVQQTGSIHCQALQEASMYIDAQGREHPCCWLGNTQKDFVTMAQVQQSWVSTPHPVCKKICSSKQNSFVNQWQREIQLC